jgi:hypothetical protein
MTCGPEFVEDIDTEIQDSRVSFDTDAFDNAIRAHGVPLIHYVALPCPVGLVDLSDNRKPHPDHEGCTNGFIYEEAGKITGLFIGNSKHKNLSDAGFWDDSTVQASFPREYDGTCTPLFVAPFDRFYLAEPTLTVVTWQRYIHSETGIDRLKFPVEQVMAFKDSNGGVYKQDDDFVVQHGLIRWVGRQPAPLLDVGPGYGGRSTVKGAVCAVRYTYRPWFYVGQMMHELRVAQVTETTKGNRSIEKMPQSVLLHREYVTTNKDQQTPGSVGPGVDADMMRTVMGPMYGGGGGRFGAK